MTPYPFTKPLGASGFLCFLTLFWASGKSPVDYANPLVGTASLEDPELLGNALPGYRFDRRQIEADAFQVRVSPSCLNRKQAGRSTNVAKGFER